MRALASARPRGALGRVALAALAVVALAAIVTLGGLSTPTRHSPSPPSTITPEERARHREEAIKTVVRTLGVGLWFGGDFRSYDGVLVGTPAHRAGFPSVGGITSVNGVAVLDVVDIARALEAYPDGAVVEIGVVTGLPGARSGVYEVTIRRRA
jgi:hypothetical protein